MTEKQRQLWGRWLIAALRYDRLQRASELIRRGADLSVRHPNGDTVLYTAVAHRHYPLVPELLAAGADPNVPGGSGAYAIHLAVEWGGDNAPALLETLLHHGARIDVCDAEGATPVFLAGKSASAETIATLLKRGANISDRNTQLDTALTFACCWGYTERAAMLLDFGIDLHAQDDLGMNALAWAAKDGHAETVALPVQHGAQLDAADQGAGRL